MKILSIEDNPIFQRILRRMVGHMGHELLAAPNLAEGYTLAYTPPDLILLDINLPDGNGLDLTRRLRAERILTPIIVLTADVMTYSRQDALQAGGNEFISKPYDVDVLKALIMRYLMVPDAEQQSGL